MSKKSFVIYKDWKPLIAALYEQDRELVGELFMAIMDYQNEGSIPDITSPIYSHFFLMKQKFDADNAEYQKTCEKNKENVQKRWNEYDRKQKDTTVYERIPPNTNGYDSIPLDTDNDKDNDKDNENDKDKDKDKDKKIGGEKSPAANAAPLPFVDYESIVNDYKTTCKSLPEVRSLSDGRRKAIKARIRTRGVEEIHKAFVMAEESDFLKGANDRNWVADFDWIMNDTNMAKILDGKYENRVSRASPKEDGYDWLGRQLKEGGMI